MFAADRGPSLTAKIELAKRGYAEPPDLSMRCRHGSVCSMGDDHVIPREVFAAWYSPALTLGLLDTLNFESVVKVLHPALVSGSVQTGTETLMIDGAARHLVKLPANLWATWTPLTDFRFWATGNLIRPLAGRDAAIRAYGVRFDPIGLALVFPQISAAPGVADIVATATKGGRPAGKNGEPIASVVKRLLALPDADRASYTAEAVAAELVEEYRRLNLQPPSPDNAKRDAQGILRAVRN